MRFYEISSGFRVPINSEEQEIMDIITKNNSRHDGKSFDVRQAEVAMKMVSRGLLVYEDEGDGAYFKPNDLADIWRI